MTKPIWCGIYAITHIGTGQHYVGSSKNARLRWHQHRSALRGGRHSNLRLQRMWNIYGEEAFDFDVLEEVPFAELLSREQVYLDAFFDQVLNMLSRVDLPPSGPKSVEHKEKIRQALMGHSFSESARQKMSQTRRGRKATPGQLRGLATGADFNRGRKMSVTNWTGRHHSAKTRALLSQINTGIKRGPVSAETRMKISATKIGCPRSDETKAKMRTGMLAAWQRRKAVDASRMA